jgi:hypothetical protein
MRRILMAIVAVCFCAGFATAAPEATPQETKGQIVGKITAKDGGKITVKGEQGELKLMPHWRGGMPADGGGFDKEMLQKLEKFSVGDEVKVTWVFSEHYRIEAIENVAKSE